MATEESGTGLPASIEAAWGLRERPGKGPRPGLTLGRIVDAAVGIASADGLGAVSMSRVASELGVSTMSLYRYVSAKDELLMLMEDAAYGPPPPGEPAKDWRAGFTDWARALRTAYARHPWAVNVPVSGPPSTPNSVAWMERGLACLRRTNLSEGEKISVLMLVSDFVRNEARMTFDILAAYQRKGQSPESAMASWARLLEKLTDAEHFPAVTAALRTGEFDTPGGPDDEFVFGLERILDGVEALISSRS